LECRPYATDFVLETGCRWGRCLTRLGSADSIEITRLGLRWGCSKRAYSGYIGSEEALPFWLRPRKRALDPRRKRGAVPRHSLGAEVGESVAS
jgi:hypothetical protein